MKQPNYLPRSGLLCLCSPHLLEQNLTFHVNFHACPFIHSSAEWTVSAYVFWSHFYSHPCLFMLSVDRLLPVLASRCAAVKFIFPNKRSVVCLRFRPFSIFVSRLLFYVSLRVSVSGRIHSSLLLGAELFFFFS